MSFLYFPVIFSKESLKQSFQTIMNTLHQRSELFFSSLGISDLLHKFLFVCIDLKKGHENVLFYFHFILVIMSGLTGVPVGK